jgi:anti-sigma regulatory factor (Ser/Thr protein kinase)
MVQSLKHSQIAEPAAIHVARPAHVASAIDSARKFAAALGFNSVECDEIALAVNELATNLIKHAGEGTIHFDSIQSAGRLGIQIASYDNGPGIPDVERAVADGYSTAGGLGAGLGAVNRLMDGLEISCRSHTGLRVVCQRWVRPSATALFPRLLEFGAATRSYRSMPENGDTFVIRQWEGHALAGVIDGLGHGQFAQRAAHTARHYVECHFDQPLENIFRGVGRDCRSTRGVVMALVRFDLARHKIIVASIGNVEVRLLGDNLAPFNLRLRRGIVGLSSAPNPLPTEHAWTPGSLLVVHSDGVQSRWPSDKFKAMPAEAPCLLARKLLDDYGRIDDDATVLVVRNAKL